ncbi:hypothetical protein BZA05DRAFT_387638 [Tricharina praecox]|uniref:uncharacterized protein n=1 Tax=Tricharina praecox TaxID=43433 RepID=UPI00221E3AB0|nr:uncharacterized protein BZA05DRAFT_387638 [Tricharina praecox]KAI5857222.1 hypothetical protein BZA05DRAFT_387638 [Tricharina praecox]
MIAAAAAVMMMTMVVVARNPWHVAVALVALQFTTYVPFVVFHSTQLDSPPGNCYTSTLLLLMLRRRLCGKRIPLALYRYVYLHTHIHNCKNM